MLTILYDTNILIDVLLERTPFVQKSARVIDAAVREQVHGLLGATTVTTTYYLVSKAEIALTARKQIKKLLQHFDVASVNRTVLERAVASDFADFEDAVLYQAGCERGADGIVTRNSADFDSNDMAVYTPDELLESLDRPNQ